MDKPSAITSTILLNTYSTTRPLSANVEKYAAEPTLSETTTSETEIVHSGKTDTVSRVEMFEDVSGSGTSGQDMPEENINKKEKFLPSVEHVSIKIMLPKPDLKIGNLQKASGQLTEPDIDNAVVKINAEEESSGSGEVDNKGSPAKALSSNCYASYVYKEATLKGGYLSGNFSFVGKVSSSDDCLLKCCDSKHCDLAFMVLERCFIVACRNDSLCKPISAYHSTTYKPMLMYMPSFTQRQSSQLWQNINSDSSVKELNSKDTEMSGSGVEVFVSHAGHHDIVKDVDGKEMNLIEDFKQIKDGDSPNTFLSHKTNTGINRFGTNSYKSAEDKHSAIITLRNTITNTMAISDDDIHIHYANKKAYPSNPEVSELKSQEVAGLNCGFNEVLYNVTLRGGRHSGNFQFLEATNNITTCTQKCCYHDDCDVALLLEGYCFMVTCKNHWLCEPVPTKITKYKPIAVYRKAKDHQHLKSTYCK
jgi:hypothetical protein